MAERRQISTFVVDGESHTEATFGKDKAKDVPYLVATEDGSKDDAVFGFTSEDAMELWTRDNGLIEHYEKLSELQTRAHRRVNYKLEHIANYHLKRQTMSFEFKPRQ
jgi:hypothetical protein